MAARATQRIGPAGRQPEKRGIGALRSRSAPTAFWAVVLLLASASAAIPGEGDLVEAGSPHGDLLDPFVEEPPYPPEKADLFHRHHNHEGLPDLETESRDSASSSQGPPAVLSDPCDGYTHRSPILVDGNSDLSAGGNGVVNPDAAGTPEDPFVIEGWCITDHTSGETFEAILVKETNLHLVIRDNMIAPTGVGNGIVLENVAYTTVRENEIVGNVKGVHMVSSNDNTIMDNVIRDSRVNLFARGIEMDSSHNNVVMGNSISRIERDGVRLLYSHGNLFQDNVIADNGNPVYNAGIDVFSSDNNVFDSNLFMNNTGNGLSLSQSTNATVTQNEFVGDGLYLYMTQTSLQRTFWDHQVDDTNTVNGKPLFYLRDTDNITIDQEIGQLFLLDSSHVTIEDQQILDVSAGVVAGYSDHITIRNTTFDVNVDGIEFYRSDDNVVQGNTILRYGYHGIHLVFSNRNLVANNILDDKTTGGGHASLELEGAIDNTIRNNTINESSTWCMYLATHSRNTLVEGNSVSNCAREGIIVGESDDNLVEGNTVRDVGREGIEVMSSTGGNVVKNNVVTNATVGISVLWSSYTRVENNLVSSNGVGGPHDSGLRVCCAHGHPGNVLLNNTVVNNTNYGIYVSRPTDLIIEGNNIQGSNVTGLMVFWEDPTTPVFPVRATNNWWGHPTGPSPGSLEEPLPATPAIDACIGAPAAGLGDGLATLGTGVCFFPWLSEPNPNAGPL